MKKVLFISHCAGRTGAPLMLLNMLRWLREYSRISFEILLLADGPLRSEFAALAPVHLFPGGGERAGLLTRWRNWLGTAREVGSPLNDLKAILEKSGFNLIYSNTIVNGNALEALASLCCPVVTHVHELDYWIEQSGRENLAKVRRFSNHYIAASDAVKQNLVNKYDFPAEKIEVVHSFIPACGISADPRGIRKALGIPEDAFVILGSGYETWRKGKDLFVLLAALALKALPEGHVHFLWVGGWQSGEHRRNVLHDVEHLGLARYVHFAGEVTNPLDYFAAGDVFAMVSREDPFPLVCLEAAALGKPVVCYADSGGMSEFVESDAGFIVPYLDLELMVSKLKLMAAEPELRFSLGSAAARKVRERYDIAVGSRRIAGLIESFLESREN